MIATLSFGLRDQRDRAILLIGYAGGLRRSEIVSLDINRDDTDEGKGWIAIEEQGLILTFRGKTGWREVEIGRGSSDQTCPVHALEQYLHYSRIDFGPLFQRVTRDDRKVTGNRLSDKHVARLIKKTVRDAGIRSDLPQAERLKLFSGHSLRAGLATSANVDERYIQKQLGHASPEMTRRYQRRRDRFRVNLTKAAGVVALKRKPCKSSVQWKIYKAILLSSGEPVLNVQSLNALKLFHIVGHQDEGSGNGLTSDQHIIGSNWGALFF